MTVEGSSGHASPGDLMAEPAASPPPLLTAPTRPRRRGRRIAALAGVLVIAAAAATAVATGSVRLPGGEVSAALAPAKPSPTAVALSAAAYQQALDAMDQVLGGAVTVLGPAFSPGVVANATGALKKALSAQVDSLAKVRPPTSAGAAHQHLVDSLRALEADANFLDAQSRKDMYCEGVAAMAVFTNGSGATMFRTAAQELVTADPGRPYHVGTFLPAAIAPTSRSLGNGSKIKKAPGSSVNRLTVHNPTAQDVVLSAGPPGATSATFAFYVTAGQSATVAEVPNGSFEFHLTSGEDWDAARNTFTRNCGYVRGTSMTFTETRTQYTEGEITVPTMFAGENILNLAGFVV